MDPPVTCPHCGAIVSASADRCSACRRAVSGPQVAAGVLTPPPVPGTDNDATRFVEPVATQKGAPDPDPDATRFEPIEPIDPDVTRFVDSDVTRFASEPSRSHLEPPPTPRPTTRPPAGTRGARATAGETGPLAVGQAFGERYHIIRVLGIGGMGAVYHAWDAELGMAVALKVIRPDSVSDPDAAREMERRFKQELVLARQVTHKNVVRIHDLGEIDGIKYITMPYLEGSDLSTVLKETGKMAVPKALTIIRDVAAGLVAAHEVGIVHRDLKPANIMVLKDHAVIMDFGIARSNQLPQEVPAHPAPAEAIDSLKAAVAKTMVGTILGTVQYMAPEQFKLLDVDQRADIYALGLIFLDMLLGKRHTHASSAIEELKARIEQPPPLAQTLDPTIPKAIEQVIARCLEPDRENRFQTSADLVAALDRLDDRGEPIPIKRTVRLPYAISAAVLLLALSGYIWWTTRPAVTHDPISVVIADFVNRTGDSAFDNALVQTSWRALQEASFISAYDRSRLPSLGLRTADVPERLDAAAARGLALKQGLGVVLAGAIDRAGNGYDISVKVTETVSDKVITNVERQAASKDAVLQTLTRLMATVRKELGDDTSESAQLFAMKSISTSSLDVVARYAAGAEAQARGNQEAALQSYQEAVKLDPKFGLGYLSLAVTSRNLNHRDDANQYIKQALSYLEAMTDHEKFATRGYYYNMTGDYQQCAKEYGDSLVRYPADAGARNLRAICLALSHRYREATDEMRQAVKALPNHVSYRTNLANLAVLTGDFNLAEDQVKALPQRSVRAFLALAYSQLGRGMLREAGQTYQQLSMTSDIGASLAALGLGDLAAYEGRVSEAIRIFEMGAAADLAAKNPDSAATKYSWMAHAYLMAGNNNLAVAAAEKALLNSRGVSDRFLAARFFVEAGAIDKARPIAAALSKEFGAEPQAHGKIIDAQIALATGDPHEAVKILNEANGLLDTWFGHFDLGRAYLAAGALPQADGEFDRCLARRGEAITLMNEGPTYSYFPAVYYYQGRVREELNPASFADSYREYLKIRGNSTEDARLQDIRKRVGN
jgi:serine/threonine protein kinase/tetratricopeptide (TPR) repeat protein